MPVPCQPRSTVPEARVKVTLMGTAFLPSLAGSAGSYNPGRVPCQAWSHTAMGSLGKQGEKGCHNGSFHTSMAASTDRAVTGQWQCPTDSSAQQMYQKRPRQKATGMQENSTEPPATTLLLQNAHCILLSTLTGLTLQMDGNKIFVTRSQKAWPKPHQNWWTCFHWSIHVKFSHVRVRCLFWHLNS